MLIFHSFIPDLPPATGVRKTGALEDSQHGLNGFLLKIDVFAQFRVWPRDLQRLASGTSSVGSRHSGSFEL